MSRESEGYVSNITPMPLSLPGDSLILAVMRFTDRLILTVTRGDDNGHDVPEETI